MVAMEKSTGRDVQHAVLTFIAGGISGCVAKTSTAPLDRLKILFQAREVHYAHLRVFQALVAIGRLEGLRGFYKGNGAMMARIFPYAATQFMAYEQYKKMLRLNSSDQKEAAIHRLFAGSLAGMTAVSFTYPLDLIRTQLAFQVSEKRYAGIVDAFRKIVAEGGVRALYRGFWPTIYGMIPYAGLSFFTFETSKAFLVANFADYAITKTLPPGQAPTPADLSVPANFLCGALAGGTAQTVAYPLDVVRRRMQLEGVASGIPKYRNTIQAIYRIVRDEGIPRGLYRGLSINYLRTVPQVAVSFTIYEFLKHTFKINRPVLLS
eukprot:Opistho-2@52768